MLPQRKKIPLHLIPPSAAAKWSSEALDEGFVPVPKRLLRCLGKVFGENEGLKSLAVILTLADYLRPNLIMWPSLEYLAFTAGIEKGEFFHELHVAENKGLIRFSGNDDQLQFSIEGCINRIMESTQAPVGRGDAVIRDDDVEVPHS